MLSDRLIFDLICAFAPFPVYTLPASRRGRSEFTMEFPYFSRREPKYEDDNLYTAEGSRSSNRRNKVRHAIRRLTNPGVAPPPNLLAPEARPFRWMITSHYLPQEYQPQNLRAKAPWFIFLRCLLVDLPVQLKHGLGTESWRHHSVEPTGEIEFLTRKEFKNYPQLKWGRRVVFSEQTREEPRWLTGQWLVVAYVWSESREWLRNVDVANLISFNNETW